VLYELVEESVYTLTVSVGTRDFDQHVILRTGLPSPSLGWPSVNGSGNAGGAVIYHRHIETVRANAHALRKGRVRDCAQPARTISHSSC
jgi:hypothetical protein